MEYRISPYYEGWPWHWMVKLGFQAVESADEAETLCREWERKVSKAENVKIGSMVVFYSDPSLHLRALMMGMGSAGRTLKDANIERCRSFWRGECNIRPVTTRNVADFLEEEDIKFKLKRFHNRPLLKTTHELFGVVPV